MWERVATEKEKEKREKQKRVAVSVCLEWRNRASLIDLSAPLLGFLLL